MKYDQRSVTDSGADLLAHSKAAGKRTVFGTIAITDTQVNKDPNTLVIDDLGNFLEFPIAYVKRPAAKTWQPGGIIGNTNINPGNHGSAFLTNVNNGTGTLNNPLSINTLGIIAHTEGEDNNTLFAAGIANPGEAIVVPNDTDIPYKLTLDFGIKIDNDVSNDDIIIEVNNAGMVNFADLQEVLTNYIRINGDGTVTQSPDFQNSVKRRGVELVDQNQLNDALTNAGKFKYQGVLDCDFFDVDKNNKPDGYYQVNGDTNSNVEGFSGWGMLIIQRQGFSTFLTLISAEGTWKSVFANSKWYDWEKFTMDTVKMVDPNADILQLAGPKVYKSTWGNQNTLKNFPSQDGAANIIVSTANKDGNDASLAKKVTVIDSWGGVFENVWTFDHWNGWKTPATTDDINNAKNQLNGSITSLSDDYNAFKKAAFINQGQHNGDILDVLNSPDGYYQITGDTTNAPNGFDGYGVLIKYTAVDTFVVLKNNLNEEWHNHYTNGNWDGWQRVATQKDLDTINGQLGGFKYQGVLDCNFTDVDTKSKPDGYYQINGYSNSNINGFSGYGILIIQRQGFSTYLTLTSAEGTWKSAYANSAWTNWQRLLTDSYMVTHLDNSVDLNNVTKPGLYTIAQGDTLNTPSGINGTIMLFVHNTNDDGSGDCEQMLFCAGVGLRTRIKAWNTWSSWTQYATEDEVNAAYQNAVNTANGYTQSNAVIDNHDNTVTFNGQKLAVFPNESDTDLNTVTETGLHTFPNANCPNSPISSARITLIVLNNGSDMYQQASFEGHPAPMFRWYQQGAWDSWVQMATSDDITSAVTSANNYTNSHGADIYNWALNDAKKYTDGRIGLMDDPYINHNIIPLPVGADPADSADNMISVAITAHYDVSTHQIMLNGLVNYQNFNNTSTGGDIFFIDANCLKFSSVTSDDFKNQAFGVRNQGGWITVSMNSGNSFSGQNGYLNVTNWLIGIHQ